MLLDMANFGGLMGAGVRKEAANRGKARVPNDMGGLVSGPDLAGRGQRRRIWQTEQYFHCPVVGMCMTLEEQRRLGAMADPEAAARGDFHVHECVVANLGRENVLSRRADALLARKYASQGRKLLRMDEKEFLRHWRTALGSGDFAAELWAAAVSKSLSHGARVEVFGTSHVAFHELSKVRALHASRLQRAQEGLALLKARVKDARQSEVRQAREIAQLRGRVAGSEADLRQARTEVGRLSREVAEWRALPAAADTQARLTGLEAENGRLVAELQRRDAENERLRARLREFDSSGLAPERYGECAPGGCSPDCPSFDLCR